MIDIQLEINKLLQYSLNTGLISERDYYYSANKIISLLGLNVFKEITINETIDFYEVLNNIIDFAYENQLIDSGIVYRDLFDSKLMDCLMPRPSEVSNKFWSLYEKNPNDATNYYYELAKNSNYIRLDRISKNISWQVDSKYGKIDITINLSKPEKDPKLIAKAKLMEKNYYPKCVLCRENEGFSGHLNHPGRVNHRLIELDLNNKTFYLQYSPYVYYNEHCIVLSKEHIPMKISRDTFANLLAFVEKFPHYFLGSNADLPIVGGSILTHDHYQGGNYEFAMFKQGYKEKFTIDNYPNVEAGIVDWPLSVIRLRSENKEELIDLSTEILNLWKNYTDKESNIIAYTNEPHNTITPIARKVANKFEINLVLRNNLATEEFPEGIFHPHREHHHIKKENIGLIEVMGLAVLPGRLKEEIELIKESILKDKTIAQIKHHHEWIKVLKNKYSNLNENNLDDTIKLEIGLKFVDILAQCGVFKDVEQFKKFINSVIKNGDN